MYISNLYNSNKSNIFPGNSFLPKLQKSVKSMNQKYDWILALLLLRNTYLACSVENVKPQIFSCQLFKYSLWNRTFLLVTSITLQGPVSHGIDLRHNAINRNDFSSWDMMLEDEGARGWCDKWAGWRDRQKPADRKGQGSCDEASHLKASYDPTQLRS